MRPAAELVNVENSAWPEIRAAIEAAPYPVEVLPVDEGRAASCLYDLQVTTGSWLGAVAYHSGGLLIDDRWLRVFGAGEPSLGLADILTANQGDEPGILIAQDVLGGQFTWEQGSAGEPPTVHYFGPDELGWQDLQCGYGVWLRLMLTGWTERFYESLRWPGWRQEVGGCPPDQGIHTFPPLWSAEGKDLGAASRRAVPMAELVAQHRQAARQLDEP